MCGRCVFNGTDQKLLRKQFKVDSKDKKLNSFNITPRQKLPIIKGFEEKIFDLYQFGLIPSWSKDPKIGNKLINARSETVMDKPAFRQAFRQKRCVIPLSGFYEWHSTSRDPFYFTSKDNNQLLALAGLWEHWQSPEQNIHSCAILTTTANEQIKPIHHRMPVLLTDKTLELWLQPDLTPKRYKTILEGSHLFSLDYWPISKAVNNPQNNNAQLIEPLK